MPVIRLECVGFSRTRNMARGAFRVLPSLWGSHRSHFGNINVCRRSCDWRLFVGSDLREKLGPAATAFAFGVGTKETMEDDAIAAVPQVPDQEGDQVQEEMTQFLNE